MKKKYFNLSNQFMKKKIYHYYKGVFIHDKMHWFIQPIHKKDTTIIKECVGIYKYGVSHMFKDIKNYLLHHY